jgi:hypothetical protein
VPLKQALTAILAGMQLTPVIRDEVLLVTSKSFAETMFETRVYCVGQWVRFWPNLSMAESPQGGMGGSTLSAAMQLPPDHDRPRLHPTAATQILPASMRLPPGYDDLIELVTSSVASRTWFAGGAIKPFPVCEAVVILQTSEVHDQISNFLAALCRLRARQFPEQSFSAPSCSGSGTRALPRHWRCRR